MENNNHSEAILNDFDNYLDGHLKEVSFFCLQTKI